MYKTGTENSDIMAVFDLDGTLTVGKSVESAFLKYLLKKIKIKPVNLIAMLVYYLKNIRKDPVEAKKRNKFYLKNVSKQKVSEWVADFMKGQDDTLLVPEMIDTIKLHKSEGQKIILITGAPDILVNMLPVKQLFDYVYATKLEEFNNRYTGRINGIHYYGGVKAEMVKHLANELNIDLQKSFCYADSYEDIEMMSLFGNPVAVFPEKHLKKISLDRNWKIIE